MKLQPHSRLEELEGKFSELESRLKNSPEKEAISVLHAIIQETLRQSHAQPETSAKDGGISLEDVANLYKSAPAMEGKAENEGQPTGSRAPDFTLPDANGNPVSLSDYLGHFVILIFYPLDWSPGCSDELSLFQGEVEEFNKFDVQLLGISVDSIYSHGAWSLVRGINFPLLADFHPKGEVARRYQVMRNSDGFSERALYIIDKEGVIRFVYISPELQMIPDIYEVFEQIKNLTGQVEPSR